MMKICYLIIGCCLLLATNGLLLDGVIKAQFQNQSLMAPIDAMAYHSGLNVILAAGPDGSVYTVDVGVMNVTASVRLSFPNANIFNALGVYFINANTAIVLFKIQSLQEPGFAVATLNPSNLTVISSVYTPSNSSTLEPDELQMNSFYVSSPPTVWVTYPCYNNTAYCGMAVFIDSTGQNVTMTNLYVTPQPLYNFYYYSGFVKQQQPSNQKQFYQWVSTSGAPPQIGYQTYLMVINADAQAGYFNTTLLLMYNALSASSPSVGLLGPINNFQYQFESFEASTQYYYVGLQSTTNQSSAFVQMDNPFIYYDSNQNSTRPNNFIPFYNLANLASLSYDESLLVAFVSTTTGQVFKYQLVDDGTGVLSLGPSGTYYNTLNNMIDPTLHPDLDLQIVDAANARIFYASGDSSGSIWSVPFSDCSIYTTCGSCVASGDPYCGWCQTTGNCSVQSQCPSAGSPGVWSQSNCINCVVRPGQGNHLTLGQSSVFALDCAFLACTVINPAGIRGFVAGEAGIPLFGLPPTFSTYTCHQNPLSLYISFNGFWPQSSFVSNWSTTDSYVSLFYGSGVPLILQSTVGGTMVNCESYEDCASCTEVSRGQNPPNSCGWCVSQGVCIFQNLCPSISHINFLQSNCPSVSSATPSLIPVGAPANVTMLAMFLPVLANYSCDFLRADTQELDTVPAVSVVDNNAQLADSVYVTCPVPNYPLHNITNSTGFTWLQVGLSLPNNITVSVIEPSPLISIYDCTVLSGTIGNDGCRLCLGANVPPTYYCAYDYNNGCVGVFNISSGGSDAYAVYGSPVNCSMVTGLSALTFVSYPASILYVSGYNLVPSSPNQGYTATYIGGNITDITSCVFYNSSMLGCLTPIAFSDPGAGIVSGVNMSISRGQTVIKGSSDFQQQASQLSFVTCESYSSSCFACYTNTSNLCTWCNSSSACLSPALSSSTCSSPRQNVSSCPIPPGANNCSYWSGELQIVCDFLMNSQTQTSYTPSTNPCSYAPSSSVYIECVGNSHIYALVLPQSGLVGTIPFSLGSLSSLSILNLAYNRFNGTVPPSISNLPGLTVVNLTSNLLSGNLPTFEGSNSLEFLTLTQNQFTGPLPDSYASLPNILDISLDFNQLSGTIPNSWTQLNSLWILNLGSNQLSGDVTFLMQALSNNDNLIAFGINANQFTGTIPTVFAANTNLQLLNVEVNSLTGTLPTEFGANPSLNFFLAGFNQFNGSIPIQYFDPDIWSSLSFFRVQQNQLTGPSDQFMYNLNQMDPSSITATIFIENQIYCPFSDYPTANFILQSSGDSPSTYCSSASYSCNYWTPDQQVICNFLNQSCANCPPAYPCASGALNCDIAGTVYSISANSLNLVGTIPTEFGTLTSLQSVSASNNALGGTIPVELTNLTRLQRLDLSYNSLNGTIPYGFGGTSSRMVVFDLSNNQFSGSIPSDLFSSFAQLHLSFNQLNGTIPSFGYSNPFLDLHNNQLSGQLFALQFLSAWFVDLSHNLFDGPIPTDVLSSNLVAFNLSWNGFTSAFEEASEGGQALTQLNLSNNLLQSDIFDIFEVLFNIETLELSNNSLTGTIPTTIAAFSNLEIFDVHSNLLSGTLPTELGQLPSIFKFDIHANQITGTIPTEMGSMSGGVQQTPVMIDLSINQLNGTIPSSLCLIPSLSFLDLSNNQLSGSVVCDFTGSSLYLEYNQLNGTIPDSFFPLSWNLGNFFMHHNNFSGPSDAFMAKLDQIDEGNFLVFAGNNISCPITANFTHATLLLKNSNDNLLDCFSPNVPTPTPTPTMAPTPAPPAFPNNTQGILICEYCMSIVSVERRQKVKWVIPLDAKGLFTITSTTSDGPLNSSVLAPGDSYEYNFTEGGIYNYYSTLSYYKGSVRVNQPPISDGNSLQISFAEMVFALFVLWVYI